MIRRRWIAMILVAFLFQTGCFLKFWGKGDQQSQSGKLKKEKVYNVYGTVVEIDREHLKIKSKKGPMEFRLVDSSRKGSDFKPDATVHVFYVIRDGINQITLVVEKIK